MATKRAREGEGRAAESRQGEKRPAIRSRFEGALSIPDHVRKDAKKRGVVLHWMARSVMGDQSAPGVQLGNRMMRGWTPVPTERYPDINGPTLPGAPTSSIIERGGQILMEKPYSEWKADRDELRRENMEAMRRIHFADGVSGTHMPAFENEESQRGAQISVVQTTRRGAQFQDDDE